MTDRQYQVKTEPVLAGPETVTEDRWHQPFVQPLVNAARLAAVVLAVTAGAVGPLPVITPTTSWLAPLSEPARPPRGLTAALQTPYTTDLKPVVIATTSEDRWHLPLSEPARLPRGLNTALQQSFTVDPVALTRPEATTVDRWFAALSEPLRIAKSAALFRVDTQSTLPIPNPPFTDIRWFSPLSEPARPPRGLAPSLQIAFAVDPAALLLREATSADRWFVPLSEPVRTRTLPASQKQAIGFVAVVIPPLDSWYRRLEEPVRLRPALAPSLLPPNANPVNVPPANPPPIIDKPRPSGTVLTAQLVGGVSTVSLKGEVSNT